jgi:hypothetical protein
MSQSMIKKIIIFISHQIINMTQIFRTFQIYFVEWRRPPKFKICFLLLQQTLEIVTELFLNLQKCISIKNKSIKFNCHTKRIITI